MSRATSFERGDQFRDIGKSEGSGYLKGVAANRLTRAIPHAVWLGVLIGVADREPHRRGQLFAQF